MRSKTNTPAPHYERARQGFSGAVEVGVIEDDHRAIAAQFHQLRLSGGALAMICR